MLLFFLQDPATIERLLSIKDITMYGLLIAVIGLLIYERTLLKKELKAKDEKIYKVIEDHQNDLKENSKDVQTMSEKWSIVFHQLKEIIQYKNG